MAWMVSAAGSGSSLFTPRVAAHDAYALLWLALLTCACLWSIATLAAGLVPHVAADFELDCVLPRVGTILAGSMGIVWFAEWTATHAYGGASALSGEHHLAPHPFESDAAEASHERLAGCLTAAGTFYLVVSLLRLPPSYAAP